MKIDPNMEKPINIIKYKNKQDRSNHNGNIWNIEHLPFEMVYHYFQQLPCTIIDEVYLITTLDIAIVLSNGLYMIF